MATRVILAPLFRLQFRLTMELQKELVKIKFLFSVVFNSFLLPKTADYYQKRTKHEIQGILKVAKIPISDEAFDRAWESVQGKFTHY